MGSIKVKDILTTQELTHIENLREQTKRTRSPLEVVRNWRKAKKILKTAKGRYYLSSSKKLNQ